MELTQAHRQLGRRTIQRHELGTQTLRLSDSRGSSPPETWI